MKTALVTGAAGGLGQAICEVLAERGFNLIALDITSEENIRERLKKISNNLELVLGNVDLSQSALLQETVQKLLPHAHWSVLINNAGVSVGGKLADASLKDWNTMMSINLTAPYVLSQLFVGNALENNIQGSIINISSMVGIVGAKKPGYAASKAGLLGLTKSVALQAGPNVRCNAIYPGAMDTPMTADWDEATRQAIIKNTPMGRIPKPLEIAKIVAFLADEKESGFITGAAINATGGQYLGQ